MKSKKNKDAGIVEMVKLPQDCNQGKGPGMFVSCPMASFPPSKQLPAKRDEHGMFLSHGNGRLV